MGWEYIYISKLFFKHSKTVSYEHYCKKIRK